MTSKTKTANAVDQGVPMPQKKLPEGSRTASLVALSSGQSYCEALRFSQDTAWAEIQRQMNTMRSAMTQPMTRAKKRRPDAVYTQTVIDGRAANGDIILASVVTCL